MNKKKLNIFEFILFTIIYLYEELFLIPAKKFLKIIKKIDIYNKILKFFSRNLILNFAFIIIMLIIAETSAIAAGYFFVHKYLFLGILFYSIKVLLFIPIVDLFKKNKKNLLKIKVIKIFYYYFLLFKRLPIFYKIKYIKILIKNYINTLKTNLKILLRTKRKNNEIFSSR